MVVNFQDGLSDSDSLVAAVNSQDVAVCRNYFSIFCNIQRESEFRNYYYGSRRAPLTEAWQTTQLQDCDNGSPGGPKTHTFTQFLTTFYNSFVSVLQTERTSIPSIFPTHNLHSQRSSHQHSPLFNRPSPNAFPHYLLITALLLFPNSSKSIKTQKSSLSLPKRFWRK